MAKRDILLRLSRKQATSLQFAIDKGLAASAPDYIDQSLRIARMKLNTVVSRFDEKNAPPSPRFPDVGCSSCGQSFGPGDHGFSHCEHHKGLKGYDR